MEIFSNISYINWLIKFTQEYSSFSDYNIIYCKDILSEDDQENVKNLKYFYEDINKYAKKNYLYSINDKNGNFYKVIYNNIGFEIGIMYGKEIIYSCRRIPIENKDEFIDLNDIINDKKQDNIDYINNTLNKLSEEITTIYQEGIPIEAIKSTIDNIINEIISKKKK